MTAKQRRAEDITAQLSRAVAKGETFALYWTRERFSYGPLCFASLAEAETKGDAMVAAETRPIPSGYYERQARLVKMELHIQEHIDGAWAGVAGSSRECVCGVVYVD